MSIKVGDTIRLEYNGAIMELKLREEVCGDGVTVNSPIGQKLLAKKVGDKFQAYTPGGIVEVEILGVNAGDALSQMGGLMQ